MNIAKKTISRDHERRLVSFLANSDEVASLAATRLAARMADRNKLLEELAGQLLAAENALESAAQKAIQPAQRLQKAVESLEVARREDHEARVRVESARSHISSLKAKAHRRAADLADPRIAELRGWVLRLANVVRCEPIEEVFSAKVDGRRSTFRTPGATAAVSQAALDRLEVIAHDLLEMLTAPYGAELANTLDGKQQEAEVITRGVIQASRFDVLMEERPDLTSLPLPAV